MDVGDQEIVPGRLVKGRFLRFPVLEKFYLDK